MSQGHPKLPLSALNVLDRTGFVAALGASFEHAPWVADGAWSAGPFASVDALHAAMIGVVKRASPAAQVAFLCGHPELAGKEARQGAMTGDSTAEQASAGLDALSRAELDEMTHLNAAYRSRHGFPFVIAVRRYSKAQIFGEFVRRAANDTEAERVEALAQIGTITRLRLAALVTD